MGHEWYPAIVNTDEFRDVVLEENAVEVAFLAMVVPGVCGMRLESPVRVTPRGGELLCATLPTLTVIDAQARRLPATAATSGPADGLQSPAHPGNGRERVVSAAGT